MDDTLNPEAHLGMSVEKAMKRCRDCMWWRVRVGCVNLAITGGEKQLPSSPAATRSTATQTVITMRSASRNYPPCLAGVVLVSPTPESRQKPILGPLGTRLADLMLIPLKKVMAMHAEGYTKGGHFVKDWELGARIADHGERSGYDRDT